MTFQPDTEQQQQLIADAIANKVLEMDQRKMMWFRLVASGDRRISEIEHTIHNTGHGRVFVNCRNPYGFTALMIAAKSGCEKLVQVLVRNAANQRLMHSTGLTALAMAAQAGHTNVVRILIAHDHEMTLSHMTTFGMSIRNEANNRDLAYIVNIVDSARESMLSTKLRNCPDQSVDEWRTLQKIVAFEKEFAAGNITNIGQEQWLIAIAVAIDVNSVDHLQLLHEHADRPSFANPHLNYLEEILARVHRGRALPDVRRYIATQCETEAFLEVNWDALHETANKVSGLCMENRNTDACGRQQTL